MKVIELVVFLAPSPVSALPPGRSSEPGLNLLSPGPLSGDAGESCGGPGRQGRLPERHAQGGVGGLGLNLARLRGTLTLNRASNTAPAESTQDQTPQGGTEEITLLQVGVYVYVCVCVGENKEHALTVEC